MKLYQVDRVAQWPKPEWLVQDFIPKGTLNVLYGRPKSGKSLLSLDIALRLAKHGAKSVLYIAGEGLGSMGARLRAWKAYNGPWQEPLPLEFDLEKDDPPPHARLAFTDMILPVLNKGTLLEFVDYVRESKLFTQEVVDPDGELDEICQIDLLVVDTLSRAIAGADENSAEDMSQAVAGLDLLREKFKSTMLVLHHTPRDDDNMERGSGALRGAADTMLRLRQHSGMVVLEVDASRETESGKQKNYVIRPSLDSAVIVEWDGKTAMPKTTSEQRCLDLLAQRAMRAKELQLAMGVSTPRVYQILKALQDKGLVKHEEEDNSYTSHQPA